MEASQLSLYSLIYIDSFVCYCCGFLTEGRSWWLRRRVICTVMVSIAVVIIIICWEAIVGIRCCCWWKRRCQWGMFRRIARLINSLCFVYLNNQKWIRSRVEVDYSNHCNAFLSIIIILIELFVFEFELDQSATYFHSFVSFLHCPFDMVVIL